MTSNQSLIERPLSPRPPETADAELDLRRLWRMVWLRKWPLLGFAVIVSLIAAVVVSAMTPIYRAGATLLIQDKAAKFLALEQASGFEAPNNDYLQTEIELLKSRVLAERVVRQLDLAVHPELDPRQQPEGWVDFSAVLRGIQRLLPFAAAPSGGADESPTAKAARALMERTRVSPKGKSQLVMVEVEMADVDTAVRVANALAEGYMESKFEAGLDLSASATAWMDNRLIELREKLQASENRLQAYREAENLVDVQGVATVSATELSLTSDRLANARRQRAEAQSQYLQVESMKNGGRQALASIPAVLADPVVQQFKAIHALAQAKLDEVSQRYGPEHPAMIAARTELDAASNSLGAQVRQVIAGIERNYQLALANEQSQQALFDANKAQIQDISSKEFKVRELALEVAANRALYDTFVTRLKETAATSDQESVSARVVDQAVVPPEPVKPEKPLIVSVAALAALLAGAGLVLLRESLNDTFRTTEQVERGLNIPVLGIVPRVARARRAELARMYSDDRDRVFAESLRTIRTRMLMAGTDQPAKVVVVASALPGEGKSVVSANLACAFGQMERVLLIDADLRRPTLGKSFSFDKGAPGLTDLLAGTATAEQCIRPVAGIDMLCAGSPSKKPLELLSSAAFAALIADLRGRYDRIILDSPPTQGVSDAMLLGSFADALIFIIKSAETPSVEVERGVAQLQQNNTPVDWVILNHVDIQKARKYGYRYSSYYDYYGYGSLEEAKA